jgi:methyltransferase (TIGR00027 family)
MVAAGRAFGARHPDPKLRNPDHLVIQLLDGTVLNLIAEHPVSAAVHGNDAQSWLVPDAAGTAALMMVRTRYVDDRLDAAIGSGITQLVVLGAGFDTRAYRFAQQLQRSFEVDSPSTQVLKKQRVDATFGAPANLRYVAVDFNRESFLDRLAEAGWQPHEKTFFIWEGVTMYLDDAAARKTLTDLARAAAPGSQLVLDYTSTLIIDFMARHPNEPLNRYTRNWGEPWTFGLPDGRERAYFESSGWQLRDNMSLMGPDGRRRYLVGSDGKPLALRQPGSGLTRLRALARWLPTIARIIAKKGKGYAVAHLELGV